MFQPYTLLSSSSSYRWHIGFNSARSILWYYVQNNDSKYPEIDISTITCCVKLYLIYAIDTYVARIYNCIDYNMSYLPYSSHYHAKMIIALGYYSSCGARIYPIQNMNKHAYLRVGITWFICKYTYIYVKIKRAKGQIWKAIHAVQGFSRCTPI